MEAGLAKGSGQMAYETINLEKARYERVTEWRRDQTIPWDLAQFRGILTEDIGPSMMSGTVIFNGYLTRQAFAELCDRQVPSDPINFRDRSSCNGHERVYEDGSGYICRHCGVDMDDEDSDD